MKARYRIVVAIACVLFTATLMYGLMSWSPKITKTDPLGVFVGVDAAYDNPQEIKTLVDAISPYTNLFIIGSKGITFNETKLDDLSQYIYDRGLSFIIFTDDHNKVTPSSQWIANAKARWGNRFLGLYLYDEVGGKQLDIWQVRPVHEADNYTDAGNQYIANLKYLSRNYTAFENIQTFSSDYALYWFDYKAGYDTIFAEFGGNYSRELSIALCRGAAIAQNKDWGVMITRVYTEVPPYIESGDQLYSDMVTAYENGAKYIVIFDSNLNYTHGTLIEEHFHALRRFTEYAHQHPRTDEPTIERTAFVLPKDFAYGFRGPTDRIWGLWQADAFSYDISVQLGSLLQQYGSKLDVIYDDEVDYTRLGYGKFIFWNGTVLDG